VDRRLRGEWERLVRTKEAVLVRVGRHAPEAREHRPAPAVWSIGEVVEHLVLVEQGITSALAKAPDPSRPRIVPWDRSLRFLLLRLILKWGVRIKAPTPQILPTSETPWHALLARWEENRRTLEEWLLSVDPAIIPTPRFRHPIIGWLDVPRALTFMGDHLDHHQQQLGRLERKSR
jgi:DinB family protein